MEGRNQVKQYKLIQIIMKTQELSYCPPMCVQMDLIQEGVLCSSPDDESSITDFDLLPGTWD